MERLLFLWFGVVAAARGVGKGGAAAGGGAAVPLYAGPVEASLPLFDGIATEREALVRREGGVLLAARFVRTDVEVVREEVEGEGGSSDGDADVVAAAEAAEAIAAARRLSRLERRAAQQSAAKAARRL